MQHDQAEDKMFCFTCVQAFKQGSVSLLPKKKDAFISVGYTNWKDAAGEKSGGFLTHERSDVGCKLSRIILFCFINYIFCSATSFWYIEV